MDIVILHGTAGSPNENWFPWLKQQLESVGHKVYIPILPTPENQSVKNWCEALDKQAPRFAEKTVLIGHSCGATYILHILEVLQKPVAKSIFVSGFLNRLGNEYFDILNETFVNHEFDWKTIKKNAGKITVFHGDNDPYVPTKEAQNFADKLGVSLNLIKNGGHLNTASGYNQFSEILDVLK